MLYLFPLLILIFSPISSFAIDDKYSSIKFKALTMFIEHH